jgi:hypothetical protein
MSSDKRKPVRYTPPVQQQQTKPQFVRPPRNNFTLGGRRFNGSSTRRGTRH